MGFIANPQSDESVNGKLLRTDNKGRGSLANGRPKTLKVGDEEPDQISRMGGRLRSKIETSSRRELRGT